MKLKIKDILYFILGLAIIITGLYIAYNIIVFVFRAFYNFTNNHESVSIALITGLLAFMSVVFGKYLENRYTIKNKVREEKLKVYTEFVDWLIETILSGSVTNNVSDTLVQDVLEQKKKIVTYASDKVLTSWSKLVNESIKYQNDLTKYKSNEDKTRQYIKTIAPLFEDLIISIRKELGYKSMKIKRYDILRLYINDIDNYI